MRIYIHMYVCLCMYVHVHMPCEKKTYYVKKIKKNKKNTSHHSSCKTRPPAPDNFHFKKKKTKCTQKVQKKNYIPAPTAPACIPCTYTYTYHGKKTYHV